MCVGGRAEGYRRAGRHVGFVAAVALLLAACATPKPPAPEAPTPGPFTQVGLASWYGNAHAGKRTASGEPFDPSALTAAHRTLPLGTVVRVVNLSNRRSVEVRINDRGPADTSRIIDLSKRAAEALDFITDGTTRVRIDLVRSAP
jgi:rare lipoprotein A